MTLGDTLGHKGHHVPEDTVKAADTKVEHVVEHVVEPQTDDSIHGRNVVYDYDDQEPDIHFTTWLAVLALCMQHFAQQFAVLGPPAIVSL